MTKKTVLFILCVSFVSILYGEQPVVVSTDVYKLTAPLIIHPKEGDVLPYLESTFVLGAVNPQGSLKINGSTVSVHPEGGYLTMVDVSTGPFVIEAEVELDSQVYKAVRNIFVRSPYLPCPVEPLTIEYVNPDVDMQVISGQTINVECKASPDAEAVFKIDGVKGKFPMVSENGIYSGSYVVQPADKLRNSRVSVTVKNKKKKSMYASGRIDRFSENVPMVVEVSTVNAVLRAGPRISSDDKAGYMLFPPLGVLLNVVGKRGDEYRVRISEARYAWISVSEVELLSPGTPVPNVVVGSISVTSDDRNTFINIPVSQKIPFEVRCDVNGRFVDISFFGAYANTDWIEYKSTSSIVTLLKWFQDESDVYRLRIHTKPGSFIGYDPRYEEDGFVFELRGFPFLANKELSLQGLTVALDPGHSPDNGAIGPTFVLEKDANLAIALSLKEKLEKQGADVVMTRDGDDPVWLVDRPLIALQAKADLFISIHNNALPFDGNPLERSGYCVYYFHHTSLLLAENIHNAFKAASSEFLLKDDGLKYGNLCVIRSPQMPSVLVECCYIINPQEESYLKTKAFHSKSAEAIIQGIKSYLNVK